MPGGGDDLDDYNDPSGQPHNLESQAMGQGANGEGEHLGPAVSPGRA